MAKPARLARYDPSSVHAVWGGTPILEGRAAGSFITLDRIERTWKLDKGCDGEAARIRTNNFAGRVTFSLRAGSGINTALTVQLQSDEKTGLLVLPFSLADFSGFTLWGSPLAWLEGWPPDNFGSEEEAIREWSLICDPLIPFPGGSKEA